MARTTSDSSPLLSPSTRPRMSEDAVIVAMVAEPVASRIRAASTQASSSTEMFASLAQSASNVPIPLSTRTCLKPPPAATMSKIPAIAGRAAPVVLEMVSRSIPDPRPRVNIATTTAISRAMIGVPSTSSTCRTIWSSSLMKISAMALPSINTTGSRTLKIVMANDGRLVLTSVSSGSASKVVGTGSTTQRPASFPKRGPATMMVGTATATPSASVVPRSAPSTSMATSGPGWGGTKPCIAERPARAGIPTVISDRPDRRATR